MGYTEPTAIQREAIPHVLEGSDVVGCAQTGTGKTAAFVLPMLQLIEPGGGRVRALVVTPTRELAVQIGEVAEELAPLTGHRVAVVYGGVGYDKQLKALKEGADVLVATPGRLLDLRDRGRIDLSGVGIFVLDEADRMLDMGFWPQVRRILALLPAKRQNLLFSATMAPEILRIVRSTLTDPVRVETAPPATPVEKIKQAVYPVNGMQKVDLLLELLERESLERVLVFANTKSRSEMVYRALQRREVAVTTIHGDRNQQQRAKALDGFKDGQYRVLVATDVVARGIDIEGVSHVVNYDMPETAEDYVHRIGRTARAGAEGSAISFLSPQETDQLRRIEATIGITIACEDVEGFEYADRIVPHDERSQSRSSRVVFGGRVMGRRGGRGRRR